MNSIEKDDLGASYADWVNIGNATSVLRSSTDADNVVITTDGNLSTKIEDGELIAVGGWGDFDVVSVSATTITIADANGDSIEEFKNNKNLDGEISLSRVDLGFASISDINVSTNPTEGLAVITAAIEQVASQRAVHGALQNRLEYTVSNLMNVAEFTTSARSRIEDADFAAESARLAKAQVLQQTGTAMLAQANAAPQLVLGLIA